VTATIGHSAGLHLTLNLNPESLVQIEYTSLGDEDEEDEESLGTVEDDEEKAQDVFSVADDGGGRTGCNTD